MKSLIFIRYGEIALKGKNRPFFERQLKKNIKQALKGLEPFTIHFNRGRYSVEIQDEHVMTAIKRLQKIFGIVSVSPAYRAPLDMEVICRQALRLLEENYREGLSFKAQARRSNKQFSLTSPQINQALGAYLLDSGLDIHVNVHNPDLTIYVEVRNEGAYLYTHLFPGPGGMPSGVAGRGLLLLSGGIDSPVAGWMALKRGIELEAIHFHSPPFTGKSAVNKVLDVCRNLALYGGKITLHLAPFTAIQKAIRSQCPEEMIITLMRRSMFRVAEKLSEERHILALFTGESLGQVASQTLENIVAIERVISMPVLRPLVGLDKEEIITLAQKIDTYDISIRPFDDCCTLFVPRHPVTRPHIEDLEREELQLDLEHLVTECVNQIETQVIMPRQVQNT